MRSVTRTLLIVNIGAYLLINVFFFMMTGPQGLESTFRTFGLSPSSFAFWQPFTSMFLHGNFLHLLVNMVALWSIGMPIEREIGSSKFIKLFFISGLGGALAVMLLQSSVSVTVGASGAILGLLGAMAVFFPNALLIVFIFPMRARTAAILFGGISFLFALFDSGSGISHAGHLGGLVAGLLYSRYAIQKQRSAFEGASSGIHQSGRHNWREQDFQRMMKDFIKSSRRNPRSAFSWGGHFINPGAQKPKKETGETSKKNEKTLHLYYDSEKGEFYFG